MSAQNKSIFSYTFDGFIWKMLVDDSSCLILEIRNEEKRLVSFACIDITAGALKWKDITLSESWWVGLSAVEKGYIILFEFKDAQNPEQKGFYILDADSGKLLWKNEEAVFMGFGDGFLIASMIQGENIVYKKYIPSNGNYAGVLEAPWVPRFSAKPDIIYSHHYSQENIYFRKIGDFIISVTEKIPEASIEYLEYRDKIIISFYSRENEKLVNYLIIIGGDGNIEFLDRLNEGKGIASDSFFIVNNLLVFVKNKQELIIIEL